MKEESTLASDCTAWDRLLLLWNEGGWDMQDASLSLIFANQCSLGAVLFYEVVRDDFI